MHLDHGEIPLRIGHTALGHEPANEVAEVDALIIGVKRVDGLLGSGREQGVLRPFVVVEDFQEGARLKVTPKHIHGMLRALLNPWLLPITP